LERVGDYGVRELIVHCNTLHESVDWRTYLLKSMSNRVSSNGSGTCAHIWEAADAGAGIAVSLPVMVEREARAAAELD
jgi:hypothetical protein